MNYSTKKQVNLNNYGIGDNDIYIACKGILSKTSEIEEINLPNNRVTDKGLLTILSNLSQTIKVINVKDNKI